MKRSTERALGTLRSTRCIALGLSIVSSIACGRSRVVEAPMMSAQASASAIALVGNSPAPLAREGFDLPFKVGDRWSGTYTCRQGKTDMVLLFEAVSRSAPRTAGADGSEEIFDVEAVFEFRFAGGAGHAATDGSERMRGTYELKSRRLRLVAQEWIDQPEGYGLITLLGYIHGTWGRGTAAAGAGPLTYSGSVEGPGCSSFSAGPETSPETRPETGSAGMLPSPALTRGSSLGSARP